MKPFRAAVIGVGAPRVSHTKGGGHQIGYTHATMYRNEPRTELVAAADIHAGHLACFSEAYRPEKTYADYREMLADAKPDVVSICTYVRLHREMLERCAEAGVRGVVCEKPFVNSPCELAVVRDLAKSSGMRIVVTHIRRYYPAFREAARLMTAGRIGTPVLVTTGLEGWDISEMGSHHIDLARKMLGDPAAVWVMGQGRVTTQRGYGHAMEDHAVSIIEFQGGARLILDGGRPLAAPGFLLVGTEGTITVQDETTLDIVDRSGHSRVDFSLHPESGWNAAWSRLLAGLLDWMGGGPEPECGLTNGLAAAELGLATYVSMLRGDRVDLPLVEALDEWPVETLARRVAAHAS